MTNNKVILIGNLGGEAKEHQTEKSTFTTFSLATTDSYLKDEEWHDLPTVWHNDLIAYSPHIREMLKHYKKGTRLQAEGRLSYTFIEAVLANGKKGKIPKANIIVSNIEQRPLFKKDQLSKPANDNEQVGEIKNETDQPEQTKA